MYFAHYIIILQNWGKFFLPNLRRVDNYILMFSFSGKEDLMDNLV